MEEDLTQLWMENIDFSPVDVLKKAIIRGIAAASQFYLKREEDSAVFGLKVLRFVRQTALEKPMLCSNALVFFEQWLSRGKRLPVAELEEMESIVQSLPTSPHQKKCLEAVNAEISFFPRVVGRWNADDRPILRALEWRSEHIARALTAMCAPCFSDLRPYEFVDKGQNVADLTLRFRTISEFVTETVICAAIEGPKAASKAITKWLNVTSHLLEMHNFHMTFAIQAGLCKHQVDRLVPLFDKLSSSANRKKLALDAMFSAENRMRILIDAQLDAKKHKVPGMIPCIFWLVQKAELLLETPKQKDDGSINDKFFEAASHIFGDIREMQMCAYDKTMLREDEIMFYFLELERQERKTEDELYEMSDIAKLRLQVKTKRSSSGLGTMRRSSASSTSPDLTTLKTKKTSGGSNFLRQRADSFTGIEKLVMDL